MRANTKRLAAVSVILLASGTSASIAAADGGSQGPAIAAAHAAQHPAVAIRGVQYARFTRVCGDPQPHRFACFAITRTMVHLKPGQAVPAGVVAFRNKFAYTPGPNGGYSPDDLQALYHFNRNGGSGQTVGIVDWYYDPSIESDLDQFDAQYGFPSETAKTFQWIDENGGTTPPSTDASTDGTSVETSLDVEAVRAACAHCKIVLVQADNPTDNDVAKAENAAVAAGADIVSNSFGSPEVFNGNPTFGNSDMAAFNHPGVAILASTGDDGWYSWDFINNSIPPPAPFDSANFPSTLPSVVAVGGTFVGATSSGQRVEGVWNENGGGDGGSADGATGGGCSQLFYAAGWQAHMPGYTGAGCGGARLTADVSAIGDPALGFDYYDTDLTSGPPWGTVGGTSLASPFLAGMWAVAGGPQGIPYPGLTLYANAATHKSTVHDITEGADLYDGVLYPHGSNAFCGGDSTSACTSGPPLNGQDPNSFTQYLLDCSWDQFGHPLARTGQCDAEKGFDGPSGVGTPNGLGVFKPQVFTVFLTHPAKIHPRKRGSYKVSLKDPAPGGKASRARWSWGDGKTSTGLHVSHTYKRVGRYKLSISATDNYGITHSGFIYLKVVR